MKNLFYSHESLEVVFSEITAIRVGDCQHYDYIMLKNGKELHCRLSQKEINEYKQYVENEKVLKTTLELIKSNPLLSESDAIKKAKNILSLIYLDEKGEE